MAIARQVLVSSTKTLLADKTLGGGGNVIISNPTGSVADVWIGGDENENAGPGQTVRSITSTTGYLLKVGTSVGPIRLSGNEALNAVTNTATTTVFILRADGRP